MTVVRMIAFFLHLYRCFESGKLDDCLGGRLDRRKPLQDNEGEETLDNATEKPPCKIKTVQLKDPEKDPLRRS